MTGDAETSILRKMTGVRHENQREPPVSVLLRRACERAALDLLGLALEVTAIHQTLCPQHKLAERLPEKAMLAVLEGPSPGSLAMDLAVLNGLVEFLTIGSILPNPPVGRPPSRVDAALIAPLIDATLAGFSAALTEAGIAPWGQGAAFGAMLPDSRTLMLALGEGPFHLFELSISLCGGARKGQLLFGLAEVCAAEEHAGKNATESEGTQALRQSVMASPAIFDAVLSRLSLPLSQLQSLKVGDLLPLSADVLPQTRLEAASAETAIPVVLGQLNGFRAVRLKSAGQVHEHAENQAYINPSPSEKTPTINSRSKIKSGVPQSKVSSVKDKVDPAEGLQDLEDVLDDVGLSDVPETV